MVAFGQPRLFQLRDRHELATECAALAGTAWRQGRRGIHETVFFPAPWRGKKLFGAEYAAQLIAANTRCVEFFAHRHFAVGWRGGRREHLVGRDGRWRDAQRASACEQSKRGRHAKTKGVVLSHAALFTANTWEAIWK
jgi:hypothetical protein